MNGIRTSVPRSSPEGPTAVTSGINSGINSITNVNTSLCRDCYKSVLDATTLNTATFTASAAANVRLQTIVTPVLVTTIKIFLDLVNVFLMQAGRKTAVGSLLQSLNVNAGITTILVTVTAFIVLCYLNVAG